MIDADSLLECMKSRRVARAYTDRPVATEDLFRIAQAGRFAASGGTLRPQRFLITRDSATIARVRSFSPGMLGSPPVLIAILIDHHQLRRQWVSIDPSMIVYVDVGSATQNMLTMAHALGLGSCPVTSFSSTGVRTALQLPETISVELLVMIGYPDSTPIVMPAGTAKPVTTRELTSWEQFGRHDFD